MSMRLVVVVSEYGAAANIGGDVERFAKSFELPQEIADFIRKSRGQWSSVSLSFEDTSA